MAINLFIEHITRLDTVVFVFLNSIHTPFWDKIMWIISSTYTWIPLYLIILYLIIRKYKLKSIPVIIALIILITLSDQISTQVFKFGIQRLRPSHNEQLNGIIHIVNNYKGGLYGFISSHASNSFAFAVFVSLIFRNKFFTYSIIIWATIVSYSRIYLGVHYPLDIICGAFFGSGLAIAIYYIYMKILLKVEGFKN